MSKICFVIMPFSETQDGRDKKYWKDFFKETLKPIVEENNIYRCERSVVKPERLISDIITNLYTADLV
ncbi:hypothetical protein ACFLQK_01750, partial [bacterium]